MIQLPNLLMIGAAGRNVGKTEFACALIRRYAGGPGVTAVKITTLKERNGACPRGGKGCGVCGALRGDYELTGETGANPGKDTGRMHAAGARPVLWLKVLHDHLEAGVQALTRKLPPAACVVCESNSARSVLEPGAFLVIKAAGSTVVKDSCAAVSDHADRLVTFTGDGWDLAPDRCCFRDGVWHVPMAATAAVLAGGQSRRMGRDKSLLPMGERTLLEHVLQQVSPLVDETLIGAGDASRYAFAGWPVIPDQQAGQGPLMGILSILEAARHERVLITACDIPQLPADFLRRMLRLAARADVVMPRDDQGRCEPLLAVYTRRVAPVARAVLARGGRRVIDLLGEPGVRTEFVAVPPGDWLRNLNTPDDYRKAVGHDLV